VHRFVLVSRMETPRLSHQLAYREGPRNRLALPCVAQGLELPVDREPSNWGWVLGRGTSTEYHSVDLFTSPP
jgi:hypothetical protein